MEKRDLIEDQIEQLSKFLKNVLAALFKFKSSNNQLETINFVSMSLKDRFDLDLNQMATLSKEEFKNFLNQYEFTENQLESLSKIFFELFLIQKDNNNPSKQLLLKSIELLDEADVISNAFSVERNQRKIEFNNLINKL